MEINSFSSSISTQNTIYFWFRDYTKLTEVDSWYKLDPAQLYSPESDLTLVSKTNLNGASSAVVCDSTIYVLTGPDSFCGTREVYYFDTLRPDIGWKMGPPLISCRTQTGAAVKGGKIYAFGGVKIGLGNEKKIKKRCGPDWGEIVDPLLNTRGCITNPNPKSTRNSISETEYEYGVLADIKYKGTYLYEPESDTWKGEVPWGMGEGPRGKNSAAVDGIVYYYNRANVRSYDLKRIVPLGFSDTAMGLDGRGVRPPGNDYGDGEYPAFLVPVGDGSLCLLWESDVGLHCTKFRVSVHWDEDGDGDSEVALLATVEAFRIFSNYEPAFQDVLTVDV